MKMATMSGKLLVAANLVEQVMEFWDPTWPEIEPWMINDLNHAVLLINRVECIIATDGIESCT